MVKKLHAAGLEVILDVVYNHTGRAIAWDRLFASAASTTPPITASRPKIGLHGLRELAEYDASRVLQLIMDSLWLASSTRSIASAFFPYRASGSNHFARRDGDSNNNSWRFSWERSDVQQMLTAFVAKLIRFRKDHPVFRRPKLFQGRAIRGLGIKDIMWLIALGREMSDEEWSRSTRALGGGPAKRPGHGRA